MLMYSAAKGTLKHSLTKTLTVFVASFALSLLALVAMAGTLSPFTLWPDCDCSNSNPPHNQPNLAACNDRCRVVCPGAPLQACLDCCSVNYGTQPHCECV